MEQELISRIKGIQKELGKVIVEIDPANEAEWEAHDKATTAHKQLRSIEYSKLGQLMLPEKKAPTVECDLCKGKGLVGENIGDGTVRTDCPKCKGTGKIPVQPPLEVTVISTEEAQNVKETSPEQDTQGITAVDQGPEKPRRRRKATALADNTR